MIKTAKIKSIHSEARGLFDKQHKASRKQPPISWVESHELLSKRESILIDNQEVIAAAISQDFGNRTVHETKLRPVFGQAARALAAAFLYPPYGKMFDQVYKRLIKLRWF